MKSMAFLAVLGLSLAGGAGHAETAGELPLVYENDFEEDIGDWEKSLGDWEMTDPNAWKRIEIDGNHVLALTEWSKYLPPVRSPHNIARVKGLELTDFTLEADLKQTGREYGHRDLCLFFGYQDPSHFYYVHLATVSDAHANSIFIVNGKARESIALERTEGTDWGQEFHKVRIERRVADGSILVYFDDMKTPVMRAQDKTFLHGGIGLGSFDDTGHFDNIRISGNRVEEE